MIFNRNKVTSIINELRRPVFDWPFMKQNKSCETLTVNRQYQENPAGGMFGLLVSSDVTHKH